MSVAVNVPHPNGLGDQHSERGEVPPVRTLQVWTVTGAPLRNNGRGDGIMHADRQLMRVVAMDDGSGFERHIPITVYEIRALGEGPARGSRVEAIVAADSADEPRMIATTIGEATCSPRAR